MNPTSGNSGGSDKILTLVSANRHEPTGTDNAQQPATSAATRLDQWAALRSDVLIATISAASKAKALAQLPSTAGVTLVHTVAYFRHAVAGSGPWWRLYRREPDPDAAWQLAWEHRRERFRCSLGTGSLELAITQAKLKLDLHFNGHSAKLRESMQRPRRSTWSTFAEMFNARDNLAIDASAKCRRTYVWGTRYVFKIALGLEDDAAVDTLHLGIVDQAHGEKFFTEVRKKLALIESQAEKNKFKRLARGAFGFAKAMFSPMAVKSMRADCGLSVPDSVEQFRKAEKLSRFRASEASEFNAPADAILRRTFRQWLKLGRAPGYVVRGGNSKSKTRDVPNPLSDVARRNMFIATGLMIACGLRKNEVKQVRWGWFQSQSGTPRLCSGDIEQKNHEDHLNIRPLDPFWSLMNRVIDRNGWRGKPDEYCLAERPKVPGDHRGLEFFHGGKSDRVYWPFWHIGKWLRELGWNMQKTNHALRDCAGSLVTMRFGLYRAKIFCRHKQLATTESHYNRFVSEDAMDNNRLKWLQWAK